MQGASGCTTAHFAAVAPGLACLKMKPGKQWEISWNKRDGEGKKEHDRANLCFLCFKVSCPSLSSPGFSISAIWCCGFHMEKYLADLRDQAKSNSSGIIPEPLGKATGDQLALLHWHFSPKYSILGTLLLVWYFHTLYITLGFTIHIVLDPARCSNTTLMQGSNVAQGAFPSALD